MFNKFTEKSASEESLLEKQKNHELELEEINRKLVNSQKQNTANEELIREYQVKEIHINKELNDTKNTLQETNDTVEMLKLKLEKSEKKYEELIDEIYKAQSNEEPNNTKGKSNKDLVGVSNVNNKSDSKKELVDYSDQVVRNNLINKIKSEALPIEKLNRLLELNRAELLDYVRKVEVSLQSKEKEISSFVSLLKEKEQIITLIKNSNEQDNEMMKRKTYFKEITYEKLISKLKAYEKGFDIETFENAIIREVESNSKIGNNQNNSVDIASSTVTINNPSNKIKNKESNIISNNDNNLNINSNSKSIQDNKLSAYSNNLNIIGKVPMNNESERFSTQLIGETEMTENNNETERKTTSTFKANENEVSNKNEFSVIQNKEKADNYMTLDEISLDNIRFSNVGYQLSQQELKKNDGKKPQRTYFQLEKEERENKLSIIEESDLAYDEVHKSIVSNKEENDFTYCNKTNKNPFELAKPETVMIKFPNNISRKSLKILSKEGSYLKNMNDGEEIDLFERKKELKSCNALAVSTHNRLFSDFNPRTSQENINEEDELFTSKKSLDNVDECQQEYIDTSGMKFNDIDTRESNNVEEFKYQDIFNQDILDNNKDNERDVDGEETEYDEGEEMEEFEDEDNNGERKLKKQKLNKHKLIGRKTENDPLNNNNKTNQITSNKSKVVYLKNKDISEKAKQTTEEINKKKKQNLIKTHTKNQKTIEDLKLVFNELETFKKYDFLNLINQEFIKEYCRKNEEDVSEYEVFSDKVTEVKESHNSNKILFITSSTINIFRMNNTLKTSIKLTSLEKITISTLNSNIVCLHFKEPNVDCLILEILARMELIQFFRDLYKIQRFNRLNLKIKLKYANRFKIKRHNQLINFVVNKGDNLFLASDYGNARKLGYLLKYRRGIFGGFYEKLIIISDIGLMIFDSRQDVKPNKIVPITSSDVFKVEEKKYGKKYCFEVKTIKGEINCFACKNLEELNSWLEELDNVKVEYMSKLKI